PHNLLHKQSWLEHQFTKHVAALDQLVPAPRFGQRQYLVDDGFQLATENAFHDVEEFALGSHGRTDNLNLSVEDMTQIRLWGESGRRAASQYPAAFSRRPQRSHPGVVADVIYHDVHSTPGGDVANALVEFLILVVDQNVCPERLGLLQLFVGA